MNFDSILYSCEGGIARLTLNRPDRLNSFTSAMHAEVRSVLDRLVADGARVLVLTGAGRGFCAGQDLSDRAVAPGGAAVDLGASIEENYAPLVLRLRALPMPVIAAVNGVAAGGGCDIALACDIRFATDRARFGEVFAKIGLFPGTGGTYLLPRTVGIAKALEMIWTGDLIDAAEAERIGLVNRVVPHDELMAETRAFAARLAEGPPLALSLAKAAVYRGLDLDLAAAFDYAATAEAITLTSADHREGVQALREKRKPTFEGR